MQVSQRLRRQLRQFERACRADEQRGSYPPSETVDIHVNYLFARQKFLETLSALERAMTEKLYCTAKPPVIPTKHDLNRLYNKLGKP